MSEEIRQEGGIKFTGKMPPQFQQALQQVKAEAKNEMEEARLAQQKDPFGDIDTPPPKSPTQQNPFGGAERVPPQNPVNQAQSKIRPVGSSQLEDIIQHLRGKTFTYNEVTLPSKGVFYDGNDGPIDGVINIRPMTGEEEQILSTPRFMKKGSGINMIFQRCIKETIKPDELLSVDRTYLLIALRNISYGHEYDVEIKCPDCDKKFNHAIRLDQLMVNYCPSDFRPPLTDTLPNSSLKFGWDLPRGRDENVITDYRDKRAKEYGGAAVDDSLLFRIAMMLDNIEGLRDKTELMVVLKKLPIQDVSYLRSISIDPPFGVDTKCDVTCTLCYHDFEIELPLEAGFFFPRHKKKKEIMTAPSISGDT